MGIISEYWNGVVRRENETKLRNYIRASDIGKPYIDRYMQMTGVEPTNPFPDRVLRIFNAGKVIEFIVLRSLAMAGILNRHQKWVEIPETEEHLKIVGYLDATIGGFDTWDVAQGRMEKNMEQFKLDMDDDFVREYATKVFNGLREQYPGGWTEEMLVEIKSINSMAMNKKDLKDDDGNFAGYEHNALQLYAYLKATGLRQGILLYVSKDDFRLEELYIQVGDSNLEDLYWEDITTMTRYYRNGVVPPKEDEIIYNPKKDKFELNWKVTRSSFLTHIYGWTDEDSMEKYYHQYLLDVNRAYKHLKEDKLKPEDKQHIDHWKMHDLLPF